MALSEFENALTEVKVAEFVATRRPPKNLREKVDLSFKIQNQSVIIFELRPHFREPRTIIEHPIAKTTFTIKSGKWKIYLQRADLKWHPYKPASEVSTLDEFLAIIDEDAYGCFWG